MADDNRKDAAPEPTLSMSGQELAPAAGDLSTWGQFRLLELVGRGSFGEVYRAFDSVLEREVALKLLLAETFQNGQDLSALPEARAMARVRHPNLVQVYGVGLYNGRPGFWSDFVHGKTLNVLLAQQGAFGPREVALIGIDLAKALSAVHAANLLHRDIKASNVMREEGGRILLMDFGLTHQPGKSASLCGTVPYIAPELLRGEPASAASDLYALGVLLYHLAAGKHPFRETTPTALKAAHEAGFRPRLIDDRPDVPQPLAHVIETAMDPDPRKRFTSPGEMIAALSAAAGLGSVATATRPAPSKRRWLLAAVIALVLFAVGVYASGIRHRPLPGIASTAHQDYLKAQELLDHYYKPRNIDAAIALFQKAAKEDPSLASAYAGLGRAYWRKYRETRDMSFIDLSKVACHRALELDREIVSPHVTLARVYIDAGKTDLAQEELKKAAALNGRNPDTSSALADLYQKLGRAAEVEPKIQNAVDLAPGAWAYLNQLGVYYLSTGKYAAAAEQFQHATTLNPDNAHAWNNLGQALRRQGRLDDAQAAYRKSLGIETAFGPLSNLGTILELQGKNAEAAEVYKRAVELNRADYLSWSNLASALNGIPERKAEARETYLKAVSIGEADRLKTPEDPYLAADLGYFYAELGTMAKSLPLLRQACAQAPEDPQVLYRVGESYELLGRRTDALKLLEKALAQGLSRQTIEQNPELRALRSDPKFLVFSSVK
jgi:eukaryotic-like serine/threonine-protein kinase